MSTPNLGELSDQIYAMDQEIAAANAAIKEKERQRKELENLLLSKMEEAGTDIVRGAGSTASKSVTVRPQIRDFDELVRFIKRKSAFHLFERRISSTAYREMKEALGGKPVPGLGEFNQIRLNVRKSGG